MASTPTTPFRDKSVDITGASQAVFTDVGTQGCQERFIANPNAANAVWINPFGAAAVANGKGSFKLAAGERVTLYNTNAVNAIGTAADKLTAGER